MSFDGRGFVRSGYSSSCPNRSKLFNLFLNHRGQLYTPEHDIALKVADLVLFFKLFIDVINHLSACRLEATKCLYYDNVRDTN